MMVILFLHVVKKASKPKDGDSEQSFINFVGTVESAAFLNGNKMYLSYRYDADAYANKNATGRQNKRNMNKKANAIGNGVSWLVRGAGKNEQRAGCINLDIRSPYGS